MPTIVSLSTYPHTRIQSTQSYKTHELKTNNPGTNSPAGIGRASAHQYAHNGAKAVYICDFDSTHLATHKREIESLYPGVDVHTRQFDAANEEAVKAVVADALQKYGRLDVFFANAGIVGQPVAFTDMSAEGFAKTMNTNTIRFVFPFHFPFYIKKGISVPAWKNQKQ